MSRTSVLADTDFTVPVLSLWPDGAPGALGEEEDDIPSLAVFLPTAGCGAAVLVCPGGGYGHLANDHEGKQVAEWLNARGAAAFVLRYRHAPGYGHPYPLMDAQRAMRLVRTHAAAWSVDAARVGVWGFSAGGHLAASLSTHWDRGSARAEDPVDRQSCRPDFSILVYPVITLEPPYTHLGSRQNLLGADPNPALVEDLSNERRVTAETPPAFLFHTDDDGAVPAMNSILYYQALKAASVPAELHIYARGHHGVGLAPNDPVLGTWPARLEDWLRGQGMMA
ncbi:MAG: Acetylxylan esterase precursor [bacterium ADurb.Bin429]|nr:MAG: Acetylxylan esterase precursor [bacterium ADurb.Bin429]